MGLKGIIYLFVGGMMVAMAAIMYFAFQSLMDFAPSAKMPIQLSLGFVGLLGVVFLVLGVLGLRGSGERKKLAMDVFQRGTPAEALVTFVDRNYGLLVNNQPIYSVVEYRFRASNGQEYVKRVDDVSSELVIRNALQVGSKIQIKYLPEDPTKNVMLLPTAGIAGAPA
jgi:hypothetical protein